MNIPSPTVKVKGKRKKVLIKELVIERLKSIPDNVRVSIG